MADTANHVVALNGFNSKIKVVHKDARYLSSDSSGVDTPADLMVFEVCEEEGLCHRVISRILQLVVSMHCISTTTAPTVSFRHHALQIKSNRVPVAFSAQTFSEFQMPFDQLTGRGTVVVLQVFDCGCIGEGALHIVAAARKHLKPGCRIIPSSAQVGAD
jgi:hypothetical protein